MPSAALRSNLLLGANLIFGVFVGVSIFAAGRARLLGNGALDAVGTKHDSDCFLSANSTTLDTVPEKLLSSLDMDGIKCGEYKCIARDSDQPGVGYLISSNYPMLQFDVEIAYSWILAEYLRNELDAKHLFHGPPGKVMLVPEYADQLSNSSHVPAR